MLFFAAIAALGLLAYYFLRRQDNEESKQSGTKGTANRNRRPGRPEPRESGKSKGPQIHRRKVESEVEETIRRARARAEDLLEKGKEEKLAWEAYCLAESIRKMFSSEKFFGRGKRPGSFQTAFEVAEDARDRLIDRQREAVRQKEMAGARRLSYVGDKYVKTAVESALVVAWCAGGLTGKSRHESAQEVFYVSVSAGDVRDWDRFDRILRKEREHCMAES